MSTEEVIKSVARKLKYYFEVKRLEDSFDLSEKNQGLLQQSMLKMPSSSFYFSHPETKALLASLNKMKTTDTLHGLREYEVRKLLDSYMKTYSFQTNLLPSCYSYYTSRSHILSRRARKQRRVSRGWPTSAAVADPHISRAEAERLVNSATKIICGSELSRLGKSHHTLKRGGRESRVSLTLSDFSRPLTAYSAKGQGQGQLMTQNEKTAGGKLNNSLTKKQTTGRSRSNVSSPDRGASTLTSSFSSYSSSSSSSSSSLSSSSYSNQSTSKTSQRKIKSSDPTEADQREQQKLSSRQEDMKQQSGSQPAPDAQNSVHHTPAGVGPECEYRVYVRTGDRTGASTSALVQLTLFGAGGKTPQLELNKFSRTHKIPFQKGNEDLFVLRACHVGRLSKIQIGHDRTEMSYAWFLKNVTVYDMHDQRVYQFSCNQWLSGQDGDRKTYRNLLVDEEREFLEAPDSGTKQPTQVQQRSAQDPESPHSQNSKMKPTNESREPQLSSTVRVESATPRSRQSSLTPRNQKDEQLATKIILRSVPGNKVVDEIVLETSRIPEEEYHSDQDLF